MHSIIKYVTAILLETQPGLASSRAVTEMSATAVEGLVFGEVYSDVYEEIMRETCKEDSRLAKKLSSFRRKHSISQTCISSKALHELQMISGSHTSVDKLLYCVQFLDLVSEKFSSYQGSREKSMVGADALLQIVCQHIVAVNIYQMNAKVLFIEEFARDEQLLKGKEGYALVTMQAALHFLNASDNLLFSIYDED